MIIGSVAPGLVAPLERALEFFPELSDKKILIHETKFYGVQHTSRAYPPIVNFWGNKNNWVYTVALNRRSRIWDFFQGLTSEQKTGLFAHELSHLCYYARLSRVGLILFSLAYAFSKKFVRKIEKETDLYAIKKGAGKYLLSERLGSCHFWESHPYPENEDTYVHPIELLGAMEKQPDLYSDSVLRDCEDRLSSLKREPKKAGGYLNGMSARRKLKHSLKTSLAFFPEIYKLFRAVKKIK